MKKAIILLIVSIGLVSWKNATTNQYKKIKPITQHKIITPNLQDSDDDGYTLMKNNCYACHNPNTKSHNDIIAPPFKAVKMQYQRMYTNKEDFVNAIVNWVQNPTENKAVMLGAIGKFKIMPKLALEPENIKKIATYIYENSTEDPDWMAAHMKEKKGNKMGKGKGKGNGSCKKGRGMGKRMKRGGF